nr:FAD-dependent oxidoreductase [Petrachloros mirabilis]
MTPAPDQILRASILVVGASTAAYSAALGALQAGAAVTWVQPHPILGGQFTAQALPAPDDAPLMTPKDLIPRDRRDPKQLQNPELFAISRTQRQFRERQRQLQPVASQVRQNPGGSWVSHFSVTPWVAAQALNEAIQPYLEQKQLTLVVNAEPIAVLTEPTSSHRRQVVGVVFEQGQNRFTVQSQLTLEATDLGDLLELGQIESRVGQEARQETGEAVLPQAARPECQQAFTFCAVVELAAHPQPPLTPPPSYNQVPWLQEAEFTPTFWVKQQGQWLGHQFLEPQGMFRYRRLQRSVFDSQVRPGDVTVLNWATSPLGVAGGSPQTANGHPMGNGNDYRPGALAGVSRAERQQHLQRGRDRTQAYVYYLQTHGAPQLKPRGDLTWTPDGIAHDPYIREARRGVALTTICHEDVAAKFFPNSARARNFVDSIGIGQYHYLDMHPNDAPGHVELGDGHVSLPFTVPLGALIPLATDGLILSSKSIGTTHITNAAYRMHPVEWAIGEAGGHLAAYALREGRSIRDIAQNPSLYRRFQGHLTRFGIPLFWFNDVSHDDPDFEAIQVLATAGIVRSESQSNLNFNPQGIVTRAVACIALVNAMALDLLRPETPTFIDVPPTHFAYTSIETLAAKGIVAGVGQQRFAPSQPLLREHLAILLAKVAPERLSLESSHALHSPPTPPFRRALITLKSLRIGDLGGKGLETFQTASKRLKNVALPRDREPVQRRDLSRSLYKIDFARPV